MKRILMTLFVVVLTVSIGVFSLVGCANHNDYFYDVSYTIYGDDHAIFTKGYGTDNNGRAKNDAEVERLISVRPNERQLNYLELEYYNFIHYGMNTFTGREWGTGKEDPKEYNPTIVDTDQWCRVLAETGSKGVIFTAKHHDGFCLWQTETTEHSIKNSPYQDGKGDIVKQMADSCAKYGLKLGLYLSPWDMNAECYGKNEYNDFFKRQLTELLDGRYGEIFSIWFDGARGKDAEIDPDFEYDIAGYEEIIYSLQPNCVSALQGQDVRWVGNEAGVSRENEWSVISDGAEKNLAYQDDAEGGAELKAVKYNDSDIGSRELLAKYNKLMWKPAEVDVSIHKGWFYSDREEPKSLDHLMKIYHKAVGANSNLLLNVCPSKNGIIEERDVVRLREFGDAIRASVAHPVQVSSVKVGGVSNMRDMTLTEMQNILTEERYTAFELGENDYIMDFNFLEPKKVTRIDLREDLRYSQRVEAFDVYVRSEGGWKLVGNVGNIGNRRSLLISKKSAIVTDAVRVVIRQSRSNPVLRSVNIYSES